MPTLSASRGRMDHRTLAPDARSQVPAPTSRTVKWTANRRSEPLRCFRAWLQRVNEAAALQLFLEFAAIRVSDLARISLQWQR
jgi:hypothetical protein